jgi:hypothetical protein
VTHVEGDGAERIYKVQYDESATDGKRLESGIAYGRIAESAAISSSKPACDRKIPGNFDKKKIPPTSVTARSQPEGINAILALGHGCDRGKGWRAKDLGVDGLKKTDEGFQRLMLYDTRELKGYLAAKPEANHHDDRNQGNHQFKKRQAESVCLGRQY